MAQALNRYEPRTVEAVPVAKEYDLVQADDVVQFARIAWRRKWVILACLVLAVGAGTLYYLTRTPLYRSKAQVLVVQKRPQDFPGMDPQASYFQDDMSTHLTVIQSPWFAEGVLQRENLRELRTFAAQKNPPAVITSSLVVTQENPPQHPLYSIASTLNLEFTGPDPEETRVILGAVLRQYKEFLDETSRKFNEEVLKRITQKAEEVQKRLRAKELEYQEFRKNTPLLWSPKEDASSYKRRLAEIEAARSILSVRRGELETQLAAIRTALREGRPREEVLGMIPEASKYRTYLTLEEKLYPLLAQEKILAENFGPGHPELKAVRDQIKFTRDYYAPSSQSRDQLLNQIGKDHDVHLEDPIESYVRSLEQQLKEIETSEQALAVQFDEERKQAQEVANYELQDAQYAAEIERINQFHDTLIKQLQGVNLSTDLLGYSVNVIAPPDYGVKASPLSTRVFPVSIFLGAMLGVGLAFFLETSEKSFHTPQDVRHRLGLPVLGCIPRLHGNGRALPPANANGNGLDPLLCTHDRPNSVEAEAYRGVRAALYFSTQGKPHKVIQVSSPAVGDGKSVLAANLAISIAQSGRKTLLIDADLRRPRIHQLFRRSARNGLSSVMIGEVTWEEAVQPSAVAGLSILASGPLPPNPADLLTSSRFEEFLGSARQQYDFVLVDTPALLAVTDSRVIAPLVDGVVLTFRLARKSRAEVERTKEVLDDLQANLLGVVVNAADRYVEFTKYGEDLDRRSTPELPRASASSNGR